MSLILEPIFNKPIEREYEAWIVENIERYFRKVDQCVRLWAVSPSTEESWPADQHLLAEGKIIGLQIKRVSLSQNKSTKSPFQRVSWKLQNPSGQFELVKKRSELFYCLPTFVNRNWRRESLRHAIFWSPEDEIDYNVWYNNERSKPPYNKIVSHSNSMRWGRFYERIISCNAGAKIKSAASAEEYLKNLHGMIEEHAGYAETTIDSITRGLYLMYLPTSI